MTIEPLITKLELFAPLPDREKRLLEQSVKDVRSFARNQQIINEGDRPDEVHLLVDGWAARYKQLPDGQRPIMAFLIPGDLCDLHVALLDEMDHSIAALSPCKVAFIPRAVVRDVFSHNPRLTQALMWGTLVDEAILREWLVNIGQRPADQRAAHLICEMLFRSQVVGLTADDSFEMPITQEELSDAMGITPVHMNRVLAHLRENGMIKTEGRRITVIDLDRLMQFSDFNPNYLHHHRRRLQLLGDRAAQQPGASPQ